MDYTLAKRRYREQKNHCTGTKLDKNGAPVHMKLTFEEWADIWSRSGKWEQRGIHAGTYCMMRKSDIGHYEKGNVTIGLNSTNTSHAKKGGTHSLEHRQKNAAARLGVPRTEETKRKIGDYQRGRPKSEATKAKMSKAATGVICREETKRKLSEYNKGKPKKRVTCEQCGFETTPQNLSRHVKSRHGEGYTKVS